MGRMHIKVPGFGVITVVTDEPIGEVDIISPGRLTVESYYYGITPSDFERKFMKHNRVVWGV